MTREGVLLRFFEQLLLIFGLAMDGFAASICMGLSVASRRQGIYAAAVVTAFHIALFAVGHTLGAAFAPLAAAGPLVGAAILCALGGNMLRETLAAAGEDIPRGFDMRHAAALGFSTSVDAMTTGFSFALLSVPLGRPLLLVAAVMGSLSLFGVWAGRRLGARFRRGARLAGGGVLLALGVRNLLSLL